MEIRLDSRTVVISVDMLNEYKTKHGNRFYIQEIGKSIFKCLTKEENHSDCIVTPLTVRFQQGKEFSRCLAISKTMLESMETPIKDGKQEMEIYDDGCRHYFYFIEVTDDQLTYYPRGWIEVEEFRRRQFTLKNFSVIGLQFLSFHRDGSSSIGKKRKVASTSHPLCDEQSLRPIDEQQQQWDLFYENHPDTGELSETTFVYFIDERRKTYDSRSLFPGSWTPREDVISHWMTLYLYGECETSREMFIEKECALFSRRLQIDSDISDDLLLKHIPSICPIAETSLTTETIEMFETLFHRPSDHRWFGIPFEEALVCFRNRECTLQDGRCIVTMHQIRKTLMPWLFRTKLAERIRKNSPVIEKIRKDFFCEQWPHAMKIKMTAETTTTTTTVNEPPPIEECHRRHLFPPCIEMFKRKVDQKKDHLLHFERILFAAFLYNSGWKNVTIQKYFRQHFKSHGVSDEKYKKQYSSEVDMTKRHAKLRYGCKRLTEDGTMNNNIAQIGCPFVYLEHGDLNRLLLSMTSNKEKSDFLTDIAKSENQPRLACAKLYEFFNNEKPGFSKPYEFFLHSLKVREQQQ